jgi:hypothetical protein
MEAAGVPRLDVERPVSGWSAAQRGALVSVGRRAGTRAGSSRPAHAAAAAEERSARGPPRGTRVPTARSGRWRIELFIRPVLKHGPRSLTCMRVRGRQTHRGASNLTGGTPRPHRGRGAPSTDPDLL